ncbi:hypothetical protein QR685DRAFT_96265 [Neurospora intermedia]|uniref:C2H2-type domain-containing protein n=1 Tax=Neurospora intermedia TaxID=5142 RepID=A0ABR3D2S6_NEUIN
MATARHYEADEYTMHYPEPPQGGMFSTPVDMGISPEYYPPRSQEYTTSMAYDHSTPLYADAPYNMYHAKSPSLYPDDSNLSVDSHSASSSNAGSPLSNPGNLASWGVPLGPVVSPGIVDQGEYFHGNEYSFTPLDGYNPNFEFPVPKGPGFVDPSLIHPEVRSMAMPSYEQMYPAPNSAYPGSPALSASPQLRTGSTSPFLQNNNYPAYSPFPAPLEPQRRQSMVSYQSNLSEQPYSGDEASKEKQRCPHPECGKTFKDLKAHMLTHQTERPEKCPIATCEYHVKGFARKYDKNRHTLTHYKGTMVCGFCPGSGSAAEKSFNRADVFKRHLTAVHGVEQTPPNSRKKTGGVNGGNSGNKKLTGYAPDATGKCSTCSQTFSNAQDFYEHLDDCVLRIVQQEDPTEAINAKRLAEVENDLEVHNTLEKNNLLTTTTMTTQMDDIDEDEDMVDEDDNEDPVAGRGPKGSPSRKTKGNPANGVQKSRGLTHSRGGVALQSKARGRKNRRNYPSSWGFDKGQMTMKKRVVAVFDGPRRLAKDDMMLSTEHEVRIKLQDGKSYVTDLDVQTLRRTEGFLNATEEEKGPWISDDPTEEEKEEARRLLMLQ